ncbi:aldo/keto reductase [Cloacibacillus sp. An23]|uniref:aldo/keto reductase n=1 Tax=Cloacibacillus sp. An23 TaxID=1965591 RepID=UPI000B398DAE|nr:aldo/keto reductase [Cloacibacillus sp. An23]OUO92806.1 Fe-S oxidoreductase [Cloacibacillus sp. An23]
MKKLGFGFMRLPLTDKEDVKSVDRGQVKRMVDRFLERGFTYFDTAYMYHDHTSEDVLRETLVERHPREAFTVATKLPLMFLEKEGDQERIFDEQLKKCGVDYFDYYLLHNVNANSIENVRKYDSFGFIRKLKEEGRVRHIGFSFHDGADLLDRVLAEHPETEFVQLQINYLDWDNEGIQSRRCLETARRYGKPVFVMEPVKGGSLVEIPDEAKAMFEACTPGMSPASWAVRFAAGQEGVALVLSGMSSYEQLEDNTGYMEDFKPLTERELETLERAKGAIAAAHAIPCTACRYCVEGCPMEIPIPEYFALYNAHKHTKAGIFDVQTVYYANIAKTRAKASACVSCGQCERACPQHIKVIDRLKDVAAAFEPNEA